MNPNQPINPFSDKEVKQPEDRYLRKDRPPPSRDFREVAEEVNEKRYRDEEESLKSKTKKTLSKKTSGKTETKNSGERATSVFDLAAGFSGNATEEDDEGSSNASLSKASALAKKTDRNSTDSNSAAPLFEIYKENGKDDTKFMREQSDLAYVNPLSQNMPFEIRQAEGKSGLKLSAAKSLQEIIDQIVKEVYRLEMSGKNETVVSLKGPLLNNAHLILSEFDHAKGELNITFDNLTQAAKDILDKNQNALIEDLSKKGYTVHMVMNTTTNEVAQIEYQETGKSRDEGQNPEQREQNLGQRQQRQEER